MENKKSNSQETVGALMTGAQLSKEMFFNIVNNPNYTKKGYCSDWYYFDFNGVNVEAYDAWDDFLTMFSFTLGGETNYISMPFKPKETEIRERMLTKVYNVIKKKIKNYNREKKVLERYQSNKDYRNVRIAWTFGQLDYGFETKDEATKYRRDKFGYLYDEEAEMNRLIPLEKYVFGDCGLETNVPICKL